MSLLLSSELKGTMVSIILPEGNNPAVPLGLFIAAWQAWFNMYGGCGNSASWVARMPVYGCNISLASRLNKDSRYVYSLDVICRLLGAHRNTRQVSAAFYQVNSQYVVPAGVIGGFTRISVEAAQLTDKAIQFWEGRGAEEKAGWHRDILKLIERNIGDIQVYPPASSHTINNSHGHVAGSNGGNNDHATEHNLVSVASLADSPDVPLMTRDADAKAYLRELTSWIHHDPNQAYYRQQPFGQAVIGWDERLRSYFWPKPEKGYKKNHDELVRIALEAKPLAIAIDSGLTWNAEQKVKAVELANEIFTWGDVPQKDFTAEDVEAVVRAALLADRKPNALMNSGWTKVAAIMTAHLEQLPNRLSMSISDSRVATALIDRLDRMMAKAGITSPRDLFADLGTINGEGGTRPRPLQLKWRNGYQKWWMQVFVSELIRDIRDVLNTEDDPVTRQPYPHMPLPNGGAGPWTCRGVEMVLFMDGY